MNIEQLNARIEKKNKDIDKIQRRVAKWNKGLTAEEEQAAMGTYREFKEYASSHNMTYEKENQMYEYHRALSDLRSNIETLNNYKNKLAIATAKESATKIKVIVDFLENWKQQVRDYIKEDVKNAEAYYENQHKWCDLKNDRYSLINDWGEDEWRNKVKEVGDLVNLYRDITNPLTFEVYNKIDEDHINHERLDEILNKDAEAKYWDMVNRVTAITGEITDASNLKIGGKGNLNGIIIGKDGTANLDTIVAGGQNAGRIVNVKHGPIAHYRVICNRIER